MISAKAVHSAALLLIHLLRERPQPNHPHPKTFTRKRREARAQRQMNCATQCTLRSTLCGSYCAVLHWSAPSQDRNPHTLVKKPYRKNGEKQKDNHDLRHPVRTAFDFVLVVLRSAVLHCCALSPCTLMTHPATSPYRDHSETRHEGVVGDDIAARIVVLSCIVTHRSDHNQTTLNQTFNEGTERSKRTETDSTSQSPRERKREMAGAWCAAVQNFVLRWFVTHSASLT